MSVSIRTGLIAAARKRGAPSGPFHPSDLFTGGFGGFLVDPSDISTLWQDVAGTIPVTADQDPVARVDDISGNGNHLTADGGNTAVYSTANGRFSLSGGAFFQSGYIPQTPQTMFTAHEVSSPSIFGVMIGSRAGSTGSTNNYIGHGMIGISGVLATAGASQTIIQAGAGDRVVALGAWSASDLDLRVNRVDATTVSNGLASSGLEPTGYLHRAQGGTGTNFPAIGSNFASGVIGRLLTAQETADLEDWLAVRAGVTLP